MKKIALIIYFSLCFAASAFSGDTREDLPATWSQALKTGTEKMIREGITPNDSISMIRLMNQARFDEKLILKAQDVVIDAHQKGLPTKPIMDKAFEGIAKHVSPLLVVKAMERVSARYNYSFDLARRLTHDDTKINHLGQVLATGITAGLRSLDVEKVVNQLLDRSNREKPTIRYTLASETFLTVRDMARQGVSSKMAADVVTQALQKGFSVGEMKSMHHTFVSRARQSSAEHLAKSFSKAIQQGKMSQNASNMGKSGHAGGSGVTGNRVPKEDQVNPAAQGQVADQVMVVAAQEDLVVVVPVVQVEVALVAEAVPAGPAEMVVLEVEAAVLEVERKKYRIKKRLVTVFIRFPGCPV